MHLVDGCRFYGVRFSVVCRFKAAPVLDVRSNFRCDGVQPQFDMISARACVFLGRPSRAYAGASVFEVCWLASRPFTGGFTKRPRLQSGGHFRCCTALRRPLFKSQKRFWLRPGVEPRNLVRPGGVRRYLAPRLRGWPELHFVDFRRVATKPEGRYTQPHVVGRVRSVTAVCSLLPKMRNSCS